jgi:hypothetical protein
MLQYTNTTYNLGCKKSLLFSAVFWCIKVHVKSYEALS